LRKLQYNDFAIETQEGGLPNFFQGGATRMTRIRRAADGSSPALPNRATS
jgi:hypothetical protein